MKLENGNHPKTLPYIAGAIFLLASLNLLLMLPYTSHYRYPLGLFAGLILGAAFFAQKRILRIIGAGLLALTFADMALDNLEDLAEYFSLGSIGFLLLFLGPIVFFVAGFFEKENLILCIVSAGVTTLGNLLILVDYGLFSLLRYWFLLIIGIVLSGFINMPKQQTAKTDAAPVLAAAKTIMDSESATTKSTDSTTDIDVLTEKLTQLKQMLDKNLITQEEFERQKSKLLQ